MASTPKARKLPKPNNIMMVSTSLSTDFFKWWCVYLRPFISLTDREIDVLANLLKQRWQLSQHISDQGILDMMLLSEDTRQKIQKECNITAQHLCVVIGSLRKKEALNGNVINPRLIPNVRATDDGCFQLLVLFKDPKSVL